MIRPALPSDTDALCLLTGETGVFKPFEIDVLREVLDDFHAGRMGEDHHAVVLERDGRVLGYAYYAPDGMTDRSWYLYWIAVVKQDQGRGVGTELMAYVEADVKQRNGRILFIETSSLPRYDPTRRFYLKQGYDITGVLRDFYADGDDMVVFRKRLLSTDAPG